MKIIPHFSLKKYNTFGIEAKAALFAEIHSKKDLITILQEYKTIPKLILGGGSNILITKDIERLVLYINIKGKTIVREDENHVWIKAQAGENWHEFVLWTLNNNFGGLENLSLIPGHVGTAPIQNIGAYGVEIKDPFFSCNTLNIETQESIVFNKEACLFDYRDSIFKNKEKNNYIITSVTFKLTKKNHLLKTSYGSILKELHLRNIKEPTIQDISKAVINIRKSKLPDPTILGNSGSFFKNPIVSKGIFDTIFEKNPNMPYFIVSNNTFKIPAGWLIEQIGYKGKRIGDAGVHEKQALVLVNYGHASGTDILTLSKTIQDLIYKKFNILINTEVNIL